MVLTRDLYLEIFRKSKTNCCIVDVSTLEIVEINEAFSLAFNINPATFQTTSIKEFIDQEDLILFETDLQSIKSGRSTSFRKTLKFCTRAKETFWGDLDLIDLEEKKPHLAFVSIRDVSRYKNSEFKLVSSEAKYKQLFDHSLNAISIFDVEKECYIDCNKTFTSLYGYTKSELAKISPVDLAWSQRSDDIYKIRFEQNLIRLKNNETIRFESEHKNKKGDKVFVDVILIPFLNNEKLHIKQVTTDISERKKSREQLQQSMEDLRSKNEELEHFAYVTSHDLKEPLTTIIAFTKLIKREFEIEKDPKLLEYLDYVINSGIRLKAMVKNILEYSKLNSKSIKLEDIPILKLIREIELDLQSLSINQPVRFHLNQELPKTIQGNKSYIYQLFQNLLKNALKFKHPERDLKIEIQYQDLAKFHQFTVVDNGIGIEEKLSSEIFTIFKKGNASNSNEGNGIGLAICKKVVELHKGMIWIESELGKGSRFHFKLPKKQ